MPLLCHYIILNDYTGTTMIICAEMMAIREQEDRLKEGKGQFKCREIEQKSKDKRVEFLRREHLRLM